MTERIEELLEQVYAAPDALDLRLVLADAFLEISDPRGELIMLQHARMTSAAPDAPSKRERELLKRHRADWLGRIAPSILVTQPLVFELGFVARCTYRNNARGRERVGAPEWSTVQWVDVGNDPGSSSGLLTSDPVRRWLRTAWRVTGEDFETIATSKQSFAWRELCLGMPAGLIARDAAVRGFEACQNLPDLSRAVLLFRDWATSYDVAALRRILKAPLADQLAEIVLAKSAGLTWDEDPVVAVRAHAAEPVLRDQRIAFVSRAGRLTVDRRSDGRAALEVDLVAGGGAVLAELVQRLGRGPWKTLRIVGHTQSEGEVRLLREAAAGLALELE